MRVVAEHWCRRSIKHPEQAGSAARDELLAGPFTLSRTHTLSASSEQRRWWHLFDLGRDVVLWRDGMHRGGSVVVDVGFEVAENARNG